MSYVKDELFSGFKLTNLGALLSSQFACLYLFFQSLKILSIDMDLAERGVIRQFVTKEGLERRREF